MTSSPATDRVRMELERAISANDAARAMLSALAAWGPRQPATAEEVTAFVDGPVRAALERLYSRDRAGVLVDAVRAELGAREAAADRPTPVHELDNRITGRIPLARQRPVPVLVVARTDTLAHRLQVLASTERATVAAHGDRVAIERALVGIPLVVVLDASDPPDVPAEALVAVLARAPQHVQWIVWGTGRTHGKELAMLAELAGRSIIALREQDGLGPMVDVILSRRA